MRVAARGLVFDVDVDGPEGEVPVLLLHGWPQNSTMWDQIAPVLHANGRSTIAPDQRGYSPGARPSDVDAYAMGECVADVVAILDELDVPVVDVVGHDWGAIVAWHIAAEHPDRVRTLTAVSVPHPTPFGAAIANDEDQQQRSAYIGLFRQAGRAEDLLLEDDAMRLRALFAGIPPDRAEKFVAPLLDRDALTGTLNWYRAMTPETTACAKVSVPTTFVWGDADIAIGATAARACGDYVDSDYRFVPLVGVSHWIADEAPGALSEAILARIDV
jgi:pimeloyl-ACP methyl ester carboxylesterase